MLSSGKRLLPILSAIVAAIVAIGCASAPKPAVAAQPQSQPVAEPAAAPPIAPEPAPQAVEPTPEPFDATTVTEEVKSATFVDVRSFIESLNQIIKSQDYEAWRSNLTDDYIRFNSDPLVLAKYSEFPVIKRKGIKLLTLRDYFINVVYPSRQNDKVDDIEFVGENMIKAITVSPKGERNILYMLEKHGDAWKIGIGR